MISYKRKKRLKKNRKGKGFTSRNYTKKAVKIRSLKIDDDIQSEILSHMKKHDAATLIQNIHRKNHPQGFKVEVFVNPSLDVKFKENKESINVFKEWFEKQIEGVKYQAIISDEKIIIKDNNTLKISFSVNDPRIFEVEMTIEAIFSLDDDGNYPIFVDSKKNIHIKKPSGKNKTSLVFIKKSEDHKIKPFY